MSKEINRKRRSFSKKLALGSLATGAIATGVLPVGQMAFASTNSNKKFIFIFLRGGLDGLSVVAPYGDKDYTNMRQSLALPKPEEENGLLDLDGFFGLHPALVGLEEMYNKKQAMFFQAIASSYRNRSHFDAQNIIENGGNKAYQFKSGWINRLVAATGNNGLSISQQSPYITKGDGNITSWFPKNNALKDDILTDKLKKLYSKDPNLNKMFTKGIKLEGIVSNAMMADDAKHAKIAKANNFDKLLASSTKILTSSQSTANVTFMEVGGWDTHANQGSVNGILPRKLKLLDKALGQLPTLMGSEWKNTAVVVATEFGRTVQPNGTKGTDHGTASAAMLLGGAVNGGNVFTKWPGLARSSLYEARDLKPTMDIRSLFKTVLNSHLKVDRKIIEEQIFPNSQSARYIKYLFLS